MSATAKPTSTNNAKQKLDIQKKEEDLFTFENTTPKGEKKHLIPMPKAYHPVYVESAWYDWWEKSGFFQAENDSKKPNYVIVIPPPNVTGTLHLGHALTVSLEDCLVRWHRMSGYNCLYLPGVDHAGIATQVIVERKLKRTEGKSRFDVGREAFLKKTFEWKEQYGSTICKQLRRVGASLDWSRECFTMDDKLSAAVKEAFIRLKEKGYIYRATRLVNWDCTLTTAISNIEVEHRDIEKTEKIRVAGRKKKYEFGFLFSFAYPIIDPPIGCTMKEIVVATTRPETILGDTAIAVHPNDSRYKELVGLFCQHPFQDRKIVIVADSMVDMAFGTGAVKITPGHDFNDFECGKRHKLALINIMNDDGTLNENAKPFTGIDRLDARELVMKAIEEKGLFRDKKEHKLSVGFCQRSDDVIEPYLKPQWYMDCTGLAKEALEKAKSKELLLLPSYHEEKWAQWLGNIRDWCISRQLWWGHRIPAYFVSRINGLENKNTLDESYWFVAKTQTEALEMAQKKFDTKNIELTQDEDVLDTWFSSGLFPFSTMGWPNNTKDMHDFYPNTILETGSDILFFWVARMVFMGLSLTEKLPFKTVYLHAMVRDKFGRKMSKSLGNVIDPLDVMVGIKLPDLHKKLEEGNLSVDEVEKAKKGQKEQFPDGIPECGTDALRFSLLNYTSSAVRDINLDVVRVHSFRTFCNKLWNTVIFAHMQFKDQYKAPQEGFFEKKTNWSFSDKWIMSKLNGFIRDSIKALEEYNFASYTTGIYEFWMRDLCGIYVELCKLNQGDVTNVILHTCIEVCLRILHPAMPYITEELWQRLPCTVSEKVPSIMLAEFPKVNTKLLDEKVEATMEVLKEIQRRIRNVKATYSLNNSIKPPCFIECRDDEEMLNILRSEVSNISLLSFCGPIEVSSEKLQQEKTQAVEVVNPKIKILVSLKGYIKVEEELAKMQKKLNELQMSHSRLEKSTQAAGYEKTTELVKQQNIEKLEKLKAEIMGLLESIEKLKTFSE